MKPANISERAARLREQLAERAAPGALIRGRPSFESTRASLETVRADDVLQRVQSLLSSLPPEEIGDPAAFKQAVKLLLQNGAPGLERLIGSASSDQALLPEQLAWTEAVVLADGTRPSFLLTEGAFKKDHPFLGGWRNDMLSFAPQLRGIAACVGRIQPAAGSAANFIGTGTLVDAGKGLVLTNYHVYEAARQRWGVAMQESGGGVIQVKGDLFIDFVAESGNPASKRWRVREVRLPAGAAVGFAGLDAAVMSIEPVDGDAGALPSTKIALSASADYADGASPTFLTIGYPAAPDPSAPGNGDVDWNFVIQTLFNNRFGVKRAAPGRFLLPPGSVEGDSFAQVFSHDATTFGGASGSLLFAWKDEGAPAFGLHFAGATLSANYAESLARTAQALRGVGLTLD